MAGTIEVNDRSKYRPSRHDTNMSIAQIIAMRGTCQRGRVGAVITRNGRIIATGYNGSVIQGKHCEQLGCILTDKCRHAVHAEVNTISFASKEGIALAGSTLYCTTAPCYECAKLIIQAGIERVIYYNEYTDSMGINLLRESRIIIEELCNAKD